MSQNGKLICCRSVLILPQSVQVKITYRKFSR
jgi:hypothetical protein